MWFGTIKKIIRIFEESNSKEFRVRSYFPFFGPYLEVRITRFQESPTLRYNPPKNFSNEVVKVIEISNDLEEKIKDVPINSPMVGYFYRAPEKSSNPYVVLNQPISPGNIVCRIEAMKTQHEIDTELRGIVKKICVENNKPVEFGQTLFLIEPVEEKK